MSVIWRLTWSSSSVTRFRSLSNSLVNLLFRALYFGSLLLGLEFLQAELFLKGLNFDLLSLDFADELISMAKLRTCPHRLTNCYYS